jgi:hypothetical protein
MGATLRTVVDRERTVADSVHEEDLTTRVVEQGALARSGGGAS